MFLSWIKSCFPSNLLQTKHPRSKKDLYINNSKSHNTNVTLSKGILNMETASIFGKWRKNKEENIDKDK